MAGLLSTLEEYKTIIDRFIGTEGAILGQVIRKEMLKPGRFESQISLSSILLFLETVQDAPGLFTGDV